jgi:quercetin dioxygenase-like cupin family protein
VRRHAALVPLSHDHHHALVEARRLGRAAGGSVDDRRAQAERFLRFYSTDSIRHFREEEERLFPTLAGAEGEAADLVVQALVEHQRIHALAARLERDVAAGKPQADVMTELAELLQAHVRLEERRLFPLIEEAVPEGTLAEIDLGASDSPVVDLLRPAGSGPLWGTATDDLNATLLAWPAGGGPAEHVNHERDVLVVVLQGEAMIALDGAPHTVHAGEAVVLEKGRARSITAGPAGVRYLSVHRRRPPLQIGRGSAQP